MKKQVDASSYTISRDTTKMSARKTSKADGKDKFISVYLDRVSRMVSTTI